MLLFTVQTLTVPLNFLSISHCQPAVVCNFKSLHVHLPFALDKHAGVSPTIMFNKCEKRKCVNIGVESFTARTPDLDSRITLHPVEGILFNGIYSAGFVCMTDHIMLTPLPK